MRLLVETRANGVSNMARDAMLLELRVPCVRLYGWCAPTASLGYNQPERAVDRDAAAALGVDIVRRPTGGGAILHEPSEVTYAVVVPRGHPGMPQDLLGSFRFMSTGVLVALEALGVKPAFREAKGGKDDLCYLREAGISIVAAGRKVSGGAQRVTPTHILQHGTVLRTLDVAANARLFREDAKRIEEGVTSLEREGVAATRREVMEALADGFRKALGVDFTEE